ncbi:MAG TPA: hypothetical protein DEB09_04295, partial [Candidatus Magasanikbacteria bacterium]|nr:hypothetical protein [Candidatus Magasanikbacteria bacterium]
MKKVFHCKINSHNIDLWFFRLILVFAFFVGSFGLHGIVFSGTIVSQSFGSNGSLLTNLVGWWTFDGVEINNTTSTDKSGNSNNATLVDSPLKTTGKIGQGLYFDGINDSLNVAHSTSTNVTSSISISVWVKATSVSGTVALVEKGTINNSGYGLFLSNGKPQLFLSGMVGDSWINKDSQRSWNNVVMSSDGRYQATTVSNDYIYVSTDYGNSWTARTSTGAKYWSKIAISTNGQYQTATVNSADGRIYTSDDYGNTWTARTSTTNWVDVAMSGSGQYQTALKSSGYIAVSTDYGVNWLSKGSNTSWASIAVSANAGNYQLAIRQNPVLYHTSSDYGSTWTTHNPLGQYVSGSGLKGVISEGGNYQTHVTTYGYIFTSGDSGVNWGVHTSIGQKAWKDLAISGNYQTALETTGGCIYVSSFYSTWTAKNCVSNYWTAIAISGNGKYQTAGDSNGVLYLSSDYGNSWTQQMDISGGWTDIAISASGTFKTAVASTDYIYIARPTYTASTTLSVNNWYHIVGTYNGNTSSIYINGVLNTSTNSGSFSIGSNTSSLSIGGYVSNYFNGNLDDVRVYNRALSTQEIEKLYNIGKVTLDKISPYSMTRSLAGWWTFDGKEITAVTSTDKSGNSNNATRINGPLASIGKIGQGLSFDGVDDYLNIAHSTSTNITSTISMSAWVKPLTGFGSSSTLITKGSLSTGYMLTLYNNKPKMTLTGAGNVWADLTSYPNGSLDDINISGDGQKIFGVDSDSGNGHVYLSTDNGISWSSLKSTGYWRTVASSYDGQIIAVGQCCGGQINVSTNGGLNWSIVGPQNAMADIDMSTSGIKQVAISSGGVYVSLNSGSTWVQKTNIPVLPDRIAISDSGGVITAVDTGGKIYVSTDNGDNWTAKDSNRNWYDVAVSGDGTIQTAVVYGGQIYISTTTGNTWVAKDSNRNWSAVDMSSDGVNQTAVVSDGQIYISTTTGNTWAVKGSSRSWLAVSMSSDGDKRVVCDNTFANKSPYFSSALAVTGLNSLLINNWYHIASTYDGTNLKMFVNGNLVATSTGSATIDSNSNPLRIGGYSSNYFKG